MKHKHKHHKEPKMSSLDELEALYTAQEIPTTPAHYDSSKKGPGYLFYSKIKTHLAEWWEEFNGDLDRDGRLKYASVKTFIEKKVGGKERAILYQMIGPARKREKDCGVPYLGDWDKRRRNGFGILDNAATIKPLIKVIQNNIAAAESIKSLTSVLVEDLVQYSALQKQVHEAFAGRAFLSNRAADDKKNLARVNAYKTLLWSLTQLKIKINREIMRYHGVDPHIPQQMRDMAQIAGGVGAAAALTGIAANQAGIIGGVRSSDGSVVAPFTYDAIKLAEHLTRHAHTFKKPLPPVIEQEMKEVDDSSSSSSKSNGHSRPQ